MALSDLTLHRKPLVMVRLESPLQRVSIHFQRNCLVASSIQEAAHVEFRELRDTKLSILLHVREFVKQETVVERFMRARDIAECDCSHSRLVRQVFKPKPLALGRSLGSQLVPLAARARVALQKLRRDESGHGCFLLRG